VANATNSDGKETKVSPEKEKLSADAKAFQLRELVREQAAPVPQAAREELFGLEEIAPTLVVDTAEHPPAFRGVDDGTSRMRDAKNALRKAAREIDQDPEGAMQHYAGLIKRDRGAVA
jgi:hypothetical protein